MSIVTVTTDYRTFTLSLLISAGASRGPSDVVYTEIELKEMRRKWVKVLKLHLMSDILFKYMFV